MLQPPHSQLLTQAVQPTQLQAEVLMMAQLSVAMELLKQTNGQNVMKVTC